MSVVCNLYLMSESKRARAENKNKVRNVNISPEFQMWKHPKTPPQTTCKRNDKQHNNSAACLDAPSGSVVLGCCRLCVLVYVCVADTCEYVTEEAFSQGRRSAP